ncbi:MAG: T9SS type A sorting domain-containing protein, partial [Bacteroidota bacterium]
KMKTKILILVLLFPIYIFSQWEIKKSYSFSYYNKMFFFDDVCFLNQNYNVYCSSDNGENWTLRSVNPVELQTAYYNRLFYYKLIEENVYVSLDSCLTFNPLNTSSLAKENKLSRGFIQNDYITNFNNTMIMTDHDKYFVSFDDGWNWSYDYLPDYGIYYGGMTTSKVYRSDSHVYICSEFLDEPNYTPYGYVYEYDVSTDSFTTIFTNKVFDAIVLDSTLLIANQQLISLNLYTFQSSVLYNGGYNYIFSIAEYGDTVYMTKRSAPYNNGKVLKSNKSDLVQWEDFNDGFSADHGDIRELYVYKNYLFAVSDSILYRRELTPYIGIEEKLNKDIISIYPNPANAHIQIVMNNDHFPADISLYDIHGNLILSEKLNENESHIDVSDIAQGVYLLKVVSEKLVYSDKVIIQH